MVASKLALFHKFCFVVIDDYKFDKFKGRTPRKETILDKVGSTVPLYRELNVINSNILKDAPSILAAPTIFYTKRTQHLVPCHPSTQISWPFLLFHGRLNEKTSQRRQAPRQNILPLTII
jgi:hypothetical protein